MKGAAILGASMLAMASATVYFKEEFTPGWESRWVQSKSKSDYGVIDATAGKFYGDAAADVGMRTSQDAKFYAIAAKYDSFSNKDKDLVLQYSVKHEQKIDCGGGYLKYMPADSDLENFNGDTEYNIMFGPDVCGSSTKKVHVIFNYKGKNHLIKKTIAPETDEGTHVYTLHVKPDQKYEVFIDGKSKATGDLLSDWDFLPAKTIKDPSVSKPSQEEWDERPKIDDPEDVKPAGYDDIPQSIADPEASKPEDWDNEMDGEWEAPMVPNPEYKGEWSPKKIDNPAYKGKWVHPEIPNPEYTEDNEIYAFSSFGAVGLDVWQVKSGSIFDNIFIGDNLEEANAFREATYGKSIEGEKAMKKEDEDKAKKQADEEAAKRAAEKDEYDAEEFEFEGEGGAGGVKEEL